MKLDLKGIVAIAVTFLILASTAYLAYIYVFPPKRPVVLRVITRHGYDILDVAKAAFMSSDIAKKYNIKDVQWLSIDPSEWIDIIKTSASKEGQEIDVAWGGGPTLFDLLATNGLLSPLEGSEISSVVKQIPDTLSGAPMKRYDSKGNLVWVAAAISSFGFTVNLNYLNKAKLPVPQTWIDLANETYASTLPVPSVGVADATVSTSNTRIFEIILQRYGWEKGWEILTLTGANSVIYDESGLVRDAVIRGDIGVGNTIDFYGYTAQLENPTLCRYIIPKDGSIVNGDPIALLASSKNKEAATAFITWVLSAEGQKIWLDNRTNRLPANPAVFDTPEGKKRPDLKASYEDTVASMSINFSDDLALSYEQAVMWFYYSTITKPHSQLQETWGKLAKAKLSGKISQKDFIALVDELTNPLKLKFVDPADGVEKVFTEEYAQSISQRVFSDLDYRKALIDAWSKAAANRYNNVASELEKIVGK